MSTYNTKQKALIDEILKNNCDKEYTCEELCDILKSNGTPVGKTTVYRYLEKLSQSSMVRKTTGLNGRFATYRYIDENLNCDGHLHLRCIKCGKIIHLGCEFMHGVGDHIKNHHNFVIDNSKTVILGLCGNCC